MFGLEVGGGDCGGLEDAPHGLKKVNREAIVMLPCCSPSTLARG